MQPQRKLSIQIMKSEDAFDFLVNCYNVEVVERDGAKHYSLPLTESECSTHYFETLQELRENLCAFGLPPLVKGTTLSDEKWLQLESWIRCANIDALRETTVTVPQDIVLKPREASTLLRALGYNTYTYMLPGTVSHKSNLGYDRFEKLIELTNHIARFGLDDSCKRSDSKYPFSREDRLNFEVFAATRATFDVR
jgi:cell division control protein 6